MKSLSRVRLFATPWTPAYQAPLSMEFSRQDLLEWVAISFSRESSQSRDRTWVSCIVGTRFYHLSHQGSLNWEHTKLPPCSTLPHGIIHGLGQVDQHRTGGSITVKRLLHLQFYGPWCRRPEGRARSGKVQSEWEKVSPRFLLLPIIKSSAETPEDILYWRHSIRSIQMRPLG